MNPEEVQKKFEARVKYLQENIPPDDIYSFAEYMSICAELLLQKWLPLVDLEKECEDEVTLNIVQNVSSLVLMKTTGSSFRPDFKDFS